jgi:predicted transcriptional regulator
MRTTLDIDPDILAAIKEMARRERSSAGRVLSRLAREALTGDYRPEQQEQMRSSGVGGFRPFASRGQIVTNEQINCLRDQEGI